MGAQARSMKVVLITGFESFNLDLYKQAAVALGRACPAISLRVFSDRDLGERWLAMSGWAQAARAETGDGRRVHTTVVVSMVGMRPCGRGEGVWLHQCMVPIQGWALLGPGRKLMPPAPPLLAAAGPRRAEVEAALQGADVFFSSLLFDFDQARRWGVREERWRV